jgi:hypothetical protein
MPSESKSKAPKVRKERASRKKNPTPQVEEPLKKRESKLKEKFPTSSKTKNVKFSENIIANEKMQMDMP